MAEVPSMFGRFNSSSHPDLGDRPFLSNAFFGVRAGLSGTSVPILTRGDVYNAPDRRHRRVKLGRIGRARPTGGLRVWCTGLTTPHDLNAARWGGHSSSVGRDPVSLILLQAKPAAVVPLASEQPPVHLSPVRRTYTLYLIRQLIRRNRVMPDRCVCVRYVAALSVPPAVRCGNLSAAEQLNLRKMARPSRLPSGFRRPPLPPHGVGTCLMRQAACEEYEVGRS